MKKHLFFLGLLLIGASQAVGQSFVKESSLPVLHKAYKMVAMPDGGMLSAWIHTSGIEILRVDSAGSVLYQQAIPNDPNWAFKHISDITIHAPVDPQGQSMPLRVFVSAAQMYQGFLFAFEELPGIGLQPLWQKNVSGAATPTFQLRVLPDQTYLVNLREPGVALFRLFQLNMSGVEIKSYTFTPYLTNGGYTSGAYIYDYQSIGNDSIVFVGAVKLPNFEHEPFICHLNLLSGGYGSGFSFMIYSNFAFNGAFDRVLPITTASGRPGYLVVGHENNVDVPGSNNISIWQFHKNFNDLSFLPPAKVWSMSSSFLASNDRVNSLAVAGGNIYLGLHSSYGGVLSQIDLMQNGLINPISPVFPVSDVSPFSIDFGVSPSGSVWFGGEAAVGSSRHYRWGKMSGWNPSDVCFTPVATTFTTGPTMMYPMLLAAEPPTTTLNSGSGSIQVSSTGSALTCGSLAISTYSNSAAEFWYPNPAQGERAYFQPAESLTQESIQLEVINVQGKCVYRQQATALEFMEQGIPRPSASGLYIIRMWSAAGEQHHQWLVP